MRAGDYGEMGYGFDEARLSYPGSARFDAGIDMLDALDAVGTMLQAVRRLGLAAR